MVEAREKGLAARIRTIEDHILSENDHDVDAIMATYGDQPRYDDEPLDEHHEGRDGVRGFYEALMRALPDLEIEVRERHVTDEAVVAEFLIRGTHLGTWRGLPATGRRVEFPLTAVHVFDETDKIAGERIYYDRATIFRQVGLFHDPETRFGRVATALTHPVTMIRALLRRLGRA